MLHTYRRSSGIYYKCGFRLYKFSVDWCCFNASIKFLAKLFLTGISCLCGFRRESWRILEPACKRQPFQTRNCCFCSSGYTTNLENCALLTPLEICSHGHLLLASFLLSNFHLAFGSPFFININVWGLKCCLISS